MTYNVFSGTLNPILTSLHVLTGEGVNAESPAQPVADAGADRPRQLERRTACRVARRHMDDRTEER